MSDIQGLNEVVLDPEDPYLTLLYSVEVSDPEAMIQWALSNPDWELHVSDDPRLCEITFHSTGTGTLTVYAENDCGIRERHLDISSQVEAVGEHGISFLSIYPNPAKDRVVVGGVDSAKVQLYNSLGQLVKTMRNTNEVSLEGLAEGVYLLRITDAEGKSYTARLVVKE